MTDRVMTAMRIPREHLAEIDARAHAAGMSRTAWMIEAALQYRQPDPTAELDDVRRRLERLERNAGLAD
jgi:hypothetical protein